jgi:hypothetical protein
MSQPHFRKSLSASRVQSAGYDASLVRAIGTVVGAPGEPAWATSCCLGLGLAILTLAALPGSLQGICIFPPWALAVDSSLTGNSDANGVLEPGETVIVEPSWRTLGGTCPTSTGVTGKATGLTGPPPGGYVIQDDAAYYGTFSQFTVKQCGPSSADCYAMSVPVPAGRSASHWDVSFTETLIGSVPARSHVWTLHIGDSFTDVPRSHPFYKKIETLLHKGITSGCSSSEYCPDLEVSRGQIAIFTAKGLAKTAANIPASGTVEGQPYDCTPGGVSLFTDVDPTDMFCKHIHYLAEKNVDLGCGPGLYCPGDTLTRLQMAAFVAKALVQPGGDAAVPLTDGLSYSCDPASPNSHFTDVPVSDPFCKHANYLWAIGIIAGCSATEYCPTSQVTRDQMAKFLVNAFNLKLYGP